MEKIRKRKRMEIISLPSLRSRRGDFLKSPVEGECLAYDSRSLLTYEMSFRV